MSAHWDTLPRLEDGADAGGKGKGGGGGKAGQLAAASTTERPLPPSPLWGGLWIHNSAWNRPERSPSRAPHRVTHRVTHRMSALCRQAVGRGEGVGACARTRKRVLVGAYGWGRVHTKDLWSARHRASTAQHATCCRKREDSVPHPTPYRVARPAGRSFERSHRLNGLSLTLSDRRRRSTYMRFTELY